MHFIDTHAHIYLDDFTENLEAIMQETADEKITKIFMPNIDSSTIENLHKLESQYPEVCIPMMGLHPCYVKDNYKNELSIIEEKLQERRYSAVGEIGIDLYWDKSTQEIQEIAFRKQIEWSIDLGIPVVIHSRDSLDLTINIISEMQNGNLTGVFHCFNGTEDQAKKIVDVGFYMGIGGVVTFKKAGVDKTVATLNLDNLVLETDAPYLAPTPYRGKQNSPAYLPIIAQKIADVQETTLNEVAEKTTLNAETLFSSYFNK